MKFADSDPRAVLAPHRTIGTGVLVEAILDSSNLVDLMLYVNEIGLAAERTLFPNCSLNLVSSGCVMK